ncbi:MAG: hypothetical protein JW959_07730, partial [Pirellulales bacterium]|nr:hypothetical protein [Pirellulales bacterium]
CTHLISRQNQAGACKHAPYSGFPQQKLIIDAIRVEFGKGENKYLQARRFFDEASTTFGDPLSITIDDPLHSDVEECFILMGHYCREAAAGCCIYRT